MPVGFSISIVRLAMATSLGVKSQSQLRAMIPTLRLAS
jgi:hypothetical protein